MAEDRVGRYTRKCEGDAKWVAPGSGILSKSPTLVHRSMTMMSRGGQVGCPCPSTLIAALVH